MTHVYVVAAGYGKRILPVTTPCEFTIDADGGLRVMLTATKPLVVRHVAPDAAVDDLANDDAVADVIEGPRLPEWWLDAGYYASPLPAGWTALATGDVSPAFYLVRGADQTLFVQTARNRPSVDALAAPDQSVVDRGDDDRAAWVELAYLRDGEPWLQRHALMHSRLPVMVTVQAPRHAFDDARRTHEELVRQLVFDRQTTP